jgi:acyl-CoA synthetase (AMP-forming)/AMP-acid ligase II/acyl carrier protein
VSASVFHPAAASSLVDVLRARAAECPERKAFTFLRDGEEEEGHLTFAALDARARAIAAALQDEALAGERALLLFPPGLDFIAAFFGCLYAGVVAVPAYPPRPRRTDARLQEIAADARPRLVLCTEAVRAAGDPAAASSDPLRALPWLATDSIPPGSEAGWKEPGIGGQTLAFLQYTSGSTSTPKGVMVTHANLLHNQAMIARGFGLEDEQAVVVGWLPLYHDMGLIGTVMHPLYLGRRCVLMSPAAFLQRPLRWLEAISRHRGTTSGGPNFAYDLCVRKSTPESRSRLDLTTWTVAFNGAEPVHRATLEQFAQAFAPCGFRREALVATYGLAEATLFVSLGRVASPASFFRARASDLERGRVVPATADDRACRDLVGCGPVSDGLGVEIVDPQSSNVCAPGEVGEIWLAGPSVARGYWNRPEETAQTFEARAIGADGGPFLRTGDLGFLANGQLYVAGRVKDLIIIRGVNHYPQDIEATVQASHPALRPAAAAAFSVEEEGEERLVVVQELDRTHRTADAESVVAAIRRAVVESHEVDCQAVVLIRHGTILKTSSGKIQRRACRAAFREGTLSVVHEWRRPPETETMAAPAGAPLTEADITAWLVARLARESGLHPDELDLAQPFASFGLDSARALLLIGDLETWLGRRVNPVVLWNYPTVEKLARHLTAP